MHEDGHPMDQPTKISAARSAGVVTSHLLKSATSWQLDMDVLTHS